MTDTEKQILNDSLSKLFKIEPEILASLYNEAGELADFSPILKLDAERTSKFKTDSDSQYKRGIKEGASKIEQAVKEKYELDSDLLGVDLIDHLVVVKTEEVKTSSTKDISKHPDYIKMQNEIDKKLSARDKEWQQKMDALVLEHNRSQMFEKVRDKALANLEARKPILPTDPRKAMVWKDTYLNELKQHNYQDGTDGALIVLDKEGEILRNEHGKIVSFDEFEKGVSDKYFEYPVAEDRDSPGNKLPGNPPPPGGNGFVPPKDEDERFERLRDPKITPKQRKELTEYVIK